jgi:hypothetical protein
MVAKEEADRSRMAMGWEMARCARSRKTSAARKIVAMPPRRRRFSDMRLK